MQSGYRGRSLVWLGTTQLAFGIIAFVVGWACSFGMCREERINSNGQWGGVLVGCVQLPMTMLCHGNGILMTGFFWGKSTGRWWMPFAKASNTKLRSLFLLVRVSCWTVRYQWLKWLKMHQFSSRQNITWREWYAYTSRCAVFCQLVKQK